MQAGAAAGGGRCGGVLCCALLCCAAAGGAPCVCAADELCRMAAAQQRPRERAPRRRPLLARCSHQPPLAALAFPWLAGAVHLWLRHRSLLLAHRPALRLWRLCCVAPPQGAAGEAGRGWERRPRRGGKGLGGQERGGKGRRWLPRSRSVCRWRLLHEQRRSPAAAAFCCPCGLGRRTDPCPTPSCPPPMLASCPCRAAQANEAEATAAVMNVNAMVAPPGQVPPIKQDQFYTAV